MAGSVDDSRMPFMEHLDDLRICLRNTAFAILGCTIVTYLFRKKLFAWMASPFFQAWDRVELDGKRLGAPEMVFTSPMENFMVHFKAALVAGVFASSPFVFRELWRFISPGLYPHERRWGLAFVVAAVLLFVGGGLFAYYYVLPAGFEYFLGYANESVDIIRAMGHKTFALRPMISMDEYFGLTTMLLLVFGLVFELPLVLSILAMLGIVSAAQLWKFNRYAIIIFAVLGAFLTPGDLVVGQLAMTGALTVLYNLSIVLALIVGRKRKAESEALISTPSP